jgi:ribosomal protein S6--L-glutamate ligase
MEYNNKGYYPLNESKKADDIQIVFLSARAEKTTKNSNSMFFFEDAARKSGLKMVTIDPSSAVIRKNSEDSYTVVEDNGTKKTYVLKPSNTIIIPRRTVLKNSESKEFIQDLQTFGFFCLNTLESIETCEDKFLTYKNLKNHGVPTPKTTVVTSSSMNKLDDKVGAVGGKFPIVCKILNGTQGIGVFIIDSMMSLRSTLQTMFKLSPKSDIILQEKIDSDYDLRVHVMYNGFERMTSGLDGFEIIGCMKRNQLAGDFRSNYSLGSTAEKGNLTPEQEKIAKMAAKATGCRWCGVDLIISATTKQPYVIEVNSSPGTKGITTAAGEDVVGTLFNMFKDFKYTKYESEQIGRYETITIKDISSDTASLDTAIKFDDDKTFTELECSSVNAKDDDVSFVFNGVTYSRELVGLKRNDPMVELNLKFNGTVYKNELVILKQINNNINRNHMVGGSKLINRITNNAVVIDKPFYLTDNTTDFDVPKDVTNESLLTEGMNWVFKVNDEEIRLTGLRSLMNSFVNGTRNRYSRGKWSIDAEDSNNWELMYNEQEFIECKDSEIKFKHSHMPYNMACKIAGVIESIIPTTVNMDVYPETENN